MQQRHELRKAGLKITLPRLKILEILEESAQRHMSAEDVYKLLLAEGSDVPYQQNAELATLLSKVPLGDEIPHALYVAVAEVLVFAYSLSGREPPHPQRKD